MTVGFCFDTWSLVINSDSWFTCYYGVVPLYLTVDFIFLIHFFLIVVNIYFLLLIIFNSLVLGVSFSCAKLYTISLSYEKDDISQQLSKLLTVRESAFHGCCFLYRNWNSNSGKWCFSVLYFHLAKTSRMLSITMTSRYNWIRSSSMWATSTNFYFYLIKECIESYYEMY